jgi:hypothetical protein
VHNVSGVRQIEVHTAEPLVPGSSHLEVEIAIAKLKKYKSPGSEEILAELIQAGGEISTNSLILFGIRKNYLISGRSLLLFKNGDTTDCNNYRGVSLLSSSYNIFSNILSRLSLYIDEIIGDLQCGFRHNRSTAVRFSAFVRYWRKN